MSKKQKTARRRPQPKRASTALVRRPTTRVIVRDPHRLLPPAPVETVGSDAMLIGSLGKITFKLTKQQEQILNRPVPIGEVLIKPTGQVYLSHPSYTRWFNEAFGRGSWQLVPAGKPVASGASVNVPYILYINGVPAAFAMGEQEYFEGNRQQTLGDAIESTVASGLRRCAKRLGVGLEMWDRTWANNFLASHGVAVEVAVWRDGKKKIETQWRRKDQPPLRNEVSQAGGGGDVDEVFDVNARAGDRRERAGTHAKERDKITDAQVGRLYAIAKSVGRSRAEVEIWLHQVKGYESAAEIKRNEYDDICQAIERRGPLGGA